MARTVDFKRFATGPGANIEAQPTFNVDEALVSGVQAGTASSALANKVWRQSSFWSELLATFISQELDIDQLDDNDLTTKLTNFGDALSVYIQENVIFQKFMTANLDFYVGGTGANNTNPERYLLLGRLYNTLLLKLVNTIPTVLPYRSLHWAFLCRYDTKRADCWYWDGYIFFCGW
jgi:hypothetical protein